MGSETRLSTFSELAQEVAESGHRPFLSGNPPRQGGSSPFRSADAASARPSAAQEAPFSAPPPTSSSRGNKPSSNNRPERVSRQRAEFQALTEKVRNIHVSLVLEALGAVGNQDGKSNKFKLPGFGNVETTGQAWYCWNEAHGDSGPIDLVMWVRNCKFSEAVKWLANEFGERVDDDEIMAAQKDFKPKEKKAFDPPMRVDKNLPFVQHYLHYERAIPMDLIDELIAQRQIYADEHRNCVFFSPGIAELRSTFDGPDAVKKLADGSTRNFGFLVLPDPQKNNHTIAICESSIDAMSHRVLHPERSSISAAGAGFDFPLQIAEQAIESGYSCVAAFDADNAGDKAAQALFNHFYLKLWLTHRLKSELGKEVDEEDVLALLETKTVDFDLAVRTGDPVRNLLFFNDPAPFSDPAKPPVIVLNIKENSLGIPQCQGVELPVHERGFRFVVDKLRLTRDRPSIGKDWNETLIYLRAQSKPQNPESSSKPTTGLSA